MADQDTTVASVTPGSTVDSTTSAPVKSPKGGTAAAAPTPQPVVVTQAAPADFRVRSRLSSRAIELDFGRGNEIRIPPTETAVIPGEFAGHPAFIAEKDNLVVLPPG